VQSLGSLLPDVLGEMNMKEDAWVCEISGCWRELVGEQIAAHARPGRMEHGILYVYVAHSIWLNELSRYGRRQMVSRLQRRFGRQRIRDVKLQLEPDG
jgi:predicted nucleic acid-binding Zn ribbon protein